MTAEALPSIQAPSLGKLLCGLNDNKKWLVPATVAMEREYQECPRKIGGFLAVFAPTKQTESNLDLSSLIDLLKRESEGMYDLQKRIADLRVRFIAPACCNRERHTIQETVLSWVNICSYLFFAVTGGVALFSDELKGGNTTIKAIATVAFVIFGIIQVTQAFLTRETNVYTQNVAKLEFLDARVLQCATMTDALIKILEASRRNIQLHKKVALTFDLLPRGTDELNFRNIINCDMFNEYCNDRGYNTLPANLGSAREVKRSSLSPRQSPDKPSPGSQHRRRRTEGRSLLPPLPPPPQEPGVPLAAGVGLGLAPIAVFIPATDEEPQAEYVPTPAAQGDMKEPEKVVVHPAPAEAEPDTNMRDAILDAALEAMAPATTSLGGVAVSIAAAPEPAPTVKAAVDTPAPAAMAPVETAPAAAPQPAAPPPSPADARRERVIRFRRAQETG